jgi:hypothetical protein
MVTTYKHVGANLELVTCKLIMDCMAGMKRKNDCKNLHDNKLPLVTDVVAAGG